jgi:hypothetical protein
MNLIISIPVENLILCGFQQDHKQKSAVFTRENTPAGSKMAQNSPFEGAYCA